MQVGTTKDQGLYNNPSAAVHPGALAAGTVLQYNTIQYKAPYLSSSTCCSYGKVKDAKSGNLLKRKAVWDIG